MRRKSERSKKAKASPEKVEKPEKPKRGRTTRRRKASSSSETESVGEVPQVPAEPTVVDLEPSPPAEEPSPEAPPAVAEESGDDKVWQVKTAESSSGMGEIKKLKICLTRPQSTPERERSPRGRKKLNRTVSSSDTPSEGSEEKRKKRHRSRRTARESHDEGELREEEVTKTEPNELIGDDITADNQKHADELNVPAQLTASTQEHPESTTCEAEEPVQEKAAEPSPPTKDTQANVIIVDNSAPQADTTEENNHHEKVETQREEKSKKLTGDVLRSSSDGEQSQERISSEVAKPVDVPVECEQRKVEELLPIKEPEKISEVIEKKVEIIEEKVPEVGDKSEDVPEINSEVRKTEDDDKISRTSKTDYNKGNKTESTQERSDIATDDKAPSESKCKDDSPKSQSPRLCEAPTSQSEHANVIESCNAKVTRRDSSCPDKETYRRNSTSKSETQNNTEERQDDASKESTTEDYIATPIVVSRKRRWGARVSKASQAKPVSISTDILKEIIPDVKPTELEEVIHEKRERKKSESSEKPRVDRPVLPKIVIDNSEQVNLHRREKERLREREREREKEREKENTSEKPLLEHRKICIVKENHSVGRPPSPPRHKISPVLYITNLVRPFTLAQLKNLLQRTGKLVPDGFWIDKIKSKCFVTYENEEEAVETRHALHGVTWPVSNPKTLQVDFSSPEALERMRTAEESGGPVSNVPGTVEDWLREQDAKKERFGDLDESKPWERRNVVREWDMGKGEKEKEREKLKKEERPLEKRRHKTPERSPEPARKFKKKEEEAPAKMLDDLFRKTKTIPCIYWLPLSAETIAVKEEQRRQHMAEHERRMQELERSRTHRRH